MSMSMEERLEVQLEYHAETCSWHFRFRDKAYGPFYSSFLAENRIAGLKRAAKAVPKEEMPFSVTFSPFSLEVLEHPRFVGLWTYRPHGRERQFSASVMVDGMTQETEMHVSWAGALREAAEILEEDPT